MTRSIDDGGIVDTVIDTVQEVTRLPGESGNMVAGVIGSVTGWNERYTPDLPQELIDGWERAASDAYNQGMEPNGPKVGGTGGGLIPAWTTLRDLLHLALQAASSAAPDKPGGVNYVPVTKTLATAQANAIMNFVFQLKLNGPVSSSGTGFSFGSPFFHMVVIPFGDSNLTPMCYVS